MGLTLVLVRSMSSLHMLDDPLADRTRQRLLALLAMHGENNTICPSEAARSLAQELDYSWQDMMRLVRAVAAEMANTGAIEVTQDGHLVDIREARGPVRLRLKQAAA